MKYELIAFDIDGTLTRSKQPLDSEMSDLLGALLDKYQVAIISGAGFEQFKWQILEPMGKRAEKPNLYLLPADGTVFCFEKTWKCEYDDALSHEEKERIKSAFANIFEEAGLERPEKFYGELVEDRGAQMNFSALGQNAPVELKEVWDPDNLKREKIVEILRKHLPEFDFHIGGTTSIEVTKPGIDKAYGLKKLLQKTGLNKQEILYVGDKLFPGGNDEPALDLGLECKTVRNPEETKTVIKDLLTSK